MKQTLLSVIMMMTIVYASAQMQYKMSKYTETYDIETVTYSYDTQHRLVAIHTVIEGMDGYDVIDSVHYNADGDIARICGWQMFYDTTAYRRWVNYVDFTYDMQHRVTTRKNYNDFGGWTLGGTYTYTYNNDGTLAKRELIFMSLLYEQTIFTYDDGLLVEEQWNTDYELTGTISPYEKITYTYDSLRRLVLSVDSGYDGGTYSLNMRDEYKYSDGNLAWHKTFDDKGRETMRNVYTYSDKLLAETLIPHTPEMDLYPTRPKHYVYNTNIYTTEEYWGLDDNFVLQHITDYTYTYIGINESGVEDVVADPVRQTIEARKVLIDGRIYIQTGDRLYDLTGRRVK